MKYYAVRHGRTNGVYESWSECEAQVKGFKNASFKSFKTRQEALDFVGNSSSAETLGNKRKADESAEQPNVKKRVFTDKYEIYVDGSCLNNQDSDNRKAGWGAVIVKDDKIILELFGPVIIDPLDAYYIGAEKMSNNTAELSAIMEALLYIQDYMSTASDISIRFDSEYASRSVTGDYNGKANIVLIANTKKIYNSLRAGETRNISMLHVLAHSGNVYNDRVDELAKRGATGVTCNVGRYSSASVNEPCSQCSRFPTSQSFISCGPKCLYYLVHRK